MTRRVLPLVLVLGLITVVGPFAIDVYLPALPSMGKSLNASPPAVQMSLMAFFSFGACAGMVIPRAIVRDLHTGHEATRLMSLLMLIVSISPLLAPLTGSFIIGAFGWRAVFAVLTVAALAGLLLAATQLRETRPAEHRSDSTWRSALSAYRLLLVDPMFTGLSFVGAFGVAAFFIYIGGASFVFIDHYGLSPTLFSLCFALNAASFFAFSQATGWLTARFGLARVIRVAVFGFAVATVILAVLMTLGADSLALMMALLFIGYGFLGVVIPTAAVLSLEHHGEIAGTASALMGSIQMVTGAAVMAVAGLFTNGAPQPMVIGIAACAVTAFLVTQIALGTK